MSAGKAHGGERRCAPVPRVRVRKATLRDLDLLVEQRRRMWADMGEVDPDSAEAREADAVYRRWARTKLRQPRRFVGLVAERGGQVVGGGAVWVMDTQPSPWNPRGKTPYLLSMYTNPDARGRGVASAIVEAALAWAKAEGHHGMRLHASRMGRGVYERFGFGRTWEMRLDWARRDRATRRGKPRKRAKPSR